MNTLESHWSFNICERKLHKANGFSAFVCKFFFPTVSVVVVRFSSVTSSPPPLLPLLSSLLCFLSSASLVLWLSTHAVQLTAPIGDDGQLMSGGSGARPVLWLSTHALQLTAPIADDGQLMSGGSGAQPVLWLSTDAVQFFRRLRRALFRSSFAFLRYSLNTFPFLLSALQHLVSVVRRWGLPKHR